MAKYNIDMSFVFKGTFTVEAKDKKQAEEFIKNHCGLVIGGNIHSTLPDEDIDWNFDVHPDKEIHYISKN